MSVEASTVRVVLPYHLRTLAKVSSEVKLQIEGPVTQRSVLDALEAVYPMLRGTIRDHGTQRRRPLLRFFACERDLSYDSPDDPLCAAAATAADKCLQEIPNPPLYQGGAGGGFDGPPMKRIQVQARFADLFAAAALVADFGAPEEQARLFDLLRAGAAQSTVMPSGCPPSCIVAKGAGVPGLPVEPSALA